MEKCFEWVTEFGFSGTAPTGWTSLEQRDGFLCVDDQRSISLEKLRSIKFRKRPHDEAVSELRRDWCKVKLVDASGALTLEGSLYVPRAHLSGIENEFPQALVCLLEACAAAQPNLQIKTAYFGRVSAGLLGLGAMTFWGIIVWGVFQSTSGTGLGLADLLPRFIVTAPLLGFGAYLLWFATRPTRKIARMQDAVAIFRDYVDGKLPLRDLPDRLTVVVP